MGLGGVDSGRRGRVLGIGWGVVWPYLLQASRWGVMAVSGTGGRGSEREWVWQEAGAGFRAAEVVGGKLWVDGTQQVGGLVYVMVRELVVTPDGVISPVQQV